MQPPNYHELLRSQIQEAFGSADIPPPVEALLQKVNNTYITLIAEQEHLKEEIKLKTEQLLSSTSRAYSFLDSLNMGFIMCDIDGEVTLTNLAVRHILAMKMYDSNPPASQTNAEWTLEAIDQLMQPDLELKKLVFQCLDSSLPLESKAVNFGKRILHVLLAPMSTEDSSDNQELGVVILIEDITEQKNLERSKDEFLSIAAHELRTPLAAIRWNASLMKKFYAERVTDKDIREIIDDVHESSVRLISIVNDFLDVSALEQGKMIMNSESFLPKDVINDVVHELQKLCDAKGLALTIQPSVDSAPAVIADKQRIRQVIYNLIGNAVKFTDKGGITVSTRLNRDFVYIMVADSGHGIPVESQGLLFHKLQQAGSSLLTRDATKGTGLGLYISKLIVELAGGKIWLESSEMGQGTTFIFTIPRA